MRNQQGETMSEAIGTMTSRGACRAMARRMRHGGAGKHARGKAVPYETYKKNRTASARADESDRHGHTPPQSPEPIGEPETGQASTRRVYRDDE